MSSAKEPNPPLTDTQENKAKIEAAVLRGLQCTAESRDRCESE